MVKFDLSIYKNTSVNIRLIDKYIKYNKINLEKLLKGLNIYWSVKAYQTTDYITGPYYSNYCMFELPYLVYMNNGQSISSSLGSTEVNWYEFTAPKKGDYRFKTIGNIDIIGELYNDIIYNGQSDDPLIDSSGSNKDGINFNFTYHLEYNQTVYLKVEPNGSITNGSYVVSINCVNHIHEYDYYLYDFDYHVLKCHCGIQDGNPIIHTIDSTYIAPVGSNLKKCFYCGCLFNKKNDIIYPVLGKENISYEK